MKTALRCAGNLILFACTLFCVQGGIDLIKSPPSPYDWRELLGVTLIALGVNVGGALLYRLLDWACRQVRA